AVTMSEDWEVITGPGFGIQAEWNARSACKNQAKLRCSNKYRRQQIGTDQDCPSRPELNARQPGDAPFSHDAEMQSEQRL
ncbi:MAG TPA: hypothetical protein VGO70_10855, partial [Arsenicitalea sp.]|nr:hypothetical protein [Arsenicitalea sp.]